MAKSLLLTYIFWLLGGFLGAHHIYLRRYKQAFIWWCFPGNYINNYYGPASFSERLTPARISNLIFITFTIGGYFGAGWFRDIWRIPEYVKDANNDPNYLTTLSEKMRELPKPPIKVITA